jgi:RNA polymerase sigma-70 factor (ECF subfamily)
LAVEAAFSAHYRSVYRYVLALTRSAADADEVTAEVFERALRGWRSEPERPQAWLLLTARRIATDRWRRASRLVAILPRLGHGLERGPAEHEIEFWSWFDALSRALTPRQREALVLRYQRDLTDADVAVVLGMSESGVRSLVARALEALRAHPELL